MGLLLTSMFAGGKLHDTSYEAERAEHQPTTSLPACVHVQSEARHGGAGYDHWVHVKNQCQSPAACDVSTNVSKTALTITVQPRETASVVTFRGSPTRTFVAYVTCHLPITDP
jgi:hypothetical protein